MSSQDSKKKRNSTFLPPMVLRSFSDPIDGPVMAGPMSNRSSALNFSNPATNNVSKMLEIPASTPQELVPIVTLYNAQQARSYIEDSCFSLTITQRKNSILNSFSNNEKKLHPHMNTINSLSDSVMMSCYASLSGNELSIYDTTDSQDNINNSNGLGPELKNPLYINIADASFHNSFSTCTLTIKNPSINIYHLQFKSVHDHIKWFSALLLAYYESNSLNEAYTAGLLAARAVTLSDIKTLLQPTRFSTGEWCNIKVSYLGSKWFRAYVVTPNNSNTKERDPTNPEDCVSVYSTDKNTNKKNLIMTFSNAASCAAVFPSTAAAIDLSSLIRVGDVNVHIHNWKTLYHLLSSDANHKGHGHSNSNSNSFIMSALQGVTSSNNNSNWSAPNSPVSSSGNRSRSSSLGSRLRKKRSTMSLLSNSDVNSSITDDSGSVMNFNSTIASSWETDFTTQVYIIPEMHPGVASFETLIRTLIPLLDSFELYGRPKRLRSDRHDPQSLLFGLPVLPKSKYLDLKQVNEMVTRKIQRKPSCRRLNSHTGYIPATNSDIKQIEKQNRQESSFTRKLLKKFSSSRGKKESKNAVPAQSSAATPGQSHIHSKGVIDVNPTHYPEYVSPNTSDVEEWSNEDWCNFLKYELKYLLGATNFEGAGHLAGDFDEFV